MQRHQWLHGWLTEYKPTRSFVIAVVLLGLYIGGCLYWVDLLSPTTNDLSHRDWRLFATYYDLLQEAIRTGTIPLYSQESIIWDTNRILSIPEFPLSPQYLLLGILSIKQFVVVNMVLVFTAGYIGLLKLRSYFRWSLLAFVPVYLLFSFNGFVVAQVVVGHMWVWAYFFLPYFALYIFQLQESTAPLRVVFKIALVWLAIILQGGVHFIAWITMFSGIAIILLPKRRVYLIAAVIAGMLAALFRLAPAASSFSEFNPQILYAYGSTHQIYHSFAVLLAPRSPNPLVPDAFVVGPQESSFYIGLVGFVLLAYFGIYRPLTSEQTAPWIQRLLVVLVLMILLTFEPIHAFIKSLDLPLLSSQRVITRILVIPFLFTMILMGQEIQALLNRLSDRTRFIIPGMLVSALIVVDLVNQLRLWEIAKYVDLYDPPTYSQTLLPIPETLTAQDTLYLNLLWISLVISLLAITGMIVYLVGTARQPTASDDALTT